VASTWRAFRECKYEVSIAVFVKHLDIRAYYNRFQPSLEMLSIIDLGDISIDVPSIEKNVLLSL